MKKGAIRIWILFWCLTCLTACIREDAYTNDPEGNFDQLWQIIDERYCFFDYKDIDWDAIGTKYRQRLYPKMDDQALFHVLNGMLFELRDGHVNLVSEKYQNHFDFWNDSPNNFNESLIEAFRYLGQDYRQVGSLKYTILSDNIGYIYYGTFADGISNSDLDAVFSYLSGCKALIFDVRQNSGGNVSSSTLIASRFTNEKVLTGYIQHKTGPGHHDFSKPYPIYLEPSKNIRWEKRVAVLTNRHSYSATNDFVKHMKCLPNAIIVGDRTGGGSGMPFSSELPNGWTISFSASPHFDREMNQTEGGIYPDVEIDMDSTDEEKGLDTIIEKARELLK